MRHFVMLATVIGGLPLFGACGVRPASTTAGQSPDSVSPASVARSVVLCETTEADLRRRLGTPTRDGILHDRHILSWTVQSEAPGKYLAVLVDTAGVVVDLYWDVPTEVPWVPTDQCAERSRGAS